MSDKKTKQGQKQLTTNKDDKNPFHKKQQIAIDDLQRKKRKWFVE